MMNDLLFNGSGYWDGTAYEAIKRVESEEKAMTREVKGQPGEIWEVETNGGVLKEMLILNTFDGYAATLTLVDTKPWQNGLRIVGDAGLLWVDCGRPGYVYYDKMVRYLRTATDDEVYGIRAGMCDALGLWEATPGVAAETENAAADPEEAIHHAQEVAALTRERDIYKGLYEGVLNGVLNLLQAKFDKMA